MESLEVRTARIEEGIVRLHDKFDGLEKQLTESVKPYQALTMKHHDEITVIKRDRSWIIFLCTVGGALSGALVELFFKIKGA